MRKIELWAVASLVAGCATYPQPNDALANSTATVRGAEEAGAEQVPDAALHLRLAEEQNGKAKQAMANGNNEEAHFLTMRAQSDAELALSLAHEEEAHQEVSQQRASLRPSAGAPTQPLAQPPVAQPPAVQPAPASIQPPPATP
jgi:hypothetical protein